MKPNQLISGLLLLFVCFVFGYYTGRKSSDEELWKISKKSIDEKNQQIDSLNNENLGLKIEVGRYMIFADRLEKRNSELYNEIFTNIE